LELPESLTDEMKADEEVLKRIHHVILEVWRLVTWPITEVPMWISGEWFRVSGIAWW